MIAKQNVAFGVANDVRGRNCIFVDKHATVV
jgi:hypothetical protein